MRKSRFSEDQIIGVLREQEPGARTGEVCRRRGISMTTFYKWKASYGVLKVCEARGLKALEDENRRLKKLLAEPVLDVTALLRNALSGCATSQLVRTHLAAVSSGRTSLGVLIPRRRRSENRITPLERLHFRSQHARLLSFLGARNW
jgi:putative transposase